MKDFKIVTGTIDYYCTLTYLKVRISKLKWMCPYRYRKGHRISVDNKVSQTVSSPVPSITTTLRHFAKCSLIHAFLLCAFLLFCIYSCRLLFILALLLFIFYTMHSWRGAPKCGFIVALCLWASDLLEWNVYSSDCSQKIYELAIFTVCNWNCPVPKVFFVVVDVLVAVMG